MYKIFSKQLDIDGLISSSLSESFLRTNQTSPQTIVSGSPIFGNGLIISSGSLNVTEDIIVSSSLIVSESININTSSVTIYQKLNVYDDVSITGSLTISGSNGIIISSSGDTILSATDLNNNSFDLKSSTSGSILNFNNEWRFITTSGSNNLNIEYFSGSIWNNVGTFYL